MCDLESGFTNHINMSNQLISEEDADKKSHEQSASIMECKKELNADCTTTYELLFSDFKWQIIQQENLNLKYAKIFTKSVSEYIFARLEDEIEYYEGNLLQVKVFGKWHTIPRKQVAFGNDGLSYKFSGTCVPAKSWTTCPIIMELKRIVESTTGESFNFVLVNRYKNGQDHMGEHRDDEKELVPTVPIASFSFGQVREFIFKHKDTRGKDAKRKDIPLVKKDLESGSLLLMEWPTNKFWYHSLPVRKNAQGVRINLTFRKMISSTFQSKKVKA